MRLTVGSQAAYGMIGLQCDDVAPTQDLLALSRLSHLLPEFRVQCSDVDDLYPSLTLQHMAIEHVH